MINLKSWKFKNFLSPSFRFELQQFVASQKERVDLARLWGWEIVHLSRLDNNPFRLKYIGRKKYRELASIILGFDSASTSNSANSDNSRQVIVSEAPIPGAIRVPKYLRAIVPLCKSLDEIVSEFDGELRRTIRKHRPSYRMRQALTDAEIDFAERELLRPYAAARHGSSAIQMSSEEVHRMAKEFGRLDFVLKEEEIVACLLGFGYACGGKRYWQIERYGYPESVFSNAKRLSETNTMNNQLEMEWAIENGYDFYDITNVFARPDDGLLKWKKRRGGFLSTIKLNGYSCFYISIPKGSAAKFLWDTPLFSIHGNKITLHLGLPGELSENDFLARFREMGFPGLHKVCLHCNTTPSESILHSLAKLYAPPLPRLECILCS